MALQDHEHYQLDNGMRVIYAPMPHARSLAMRLYLKVGPCNENEAEAGISHFLEHMAFKGCAGWPTYKDIANTIEGRGGYVNASTSREFTVYKFNILTRHWRESLRLLAAMVQPPS